MWCSDCQQDVPAVANQPHGPLVCPRCHIELKAMQAAKPTDSGIELGSFDAPVEPEPVSPWDETTRQQSEQRLRQIGRKLRTPYAVTNQSTIQPAAIPTPPIHAPAIRAKTISEQRSDSPLSRRSSGFVSVMLFIGVVGFFVGAIMLAWSAAFQLSQIWQWGMTTTIAAEGLLILGMTWMAVRLWRNSRRVNQQLYGVDRQLVEIQKQAGALSSNQLSASQNYYQHFNQTASPHFLVANLRGQVDQLASRIASS